MPTKRIDLPELIEKYHDEDACRDLLEELRWPNGLACLRCGGTTISRIKKRNFYDCDDCRYQFSVKSGTVMQDSKLPIWKWFLGAYLLCESKNGMSANQLKRTLGTTYRTAWHLSHRIRWAMGKAPQAPLHGTVEVDETWIGGKGTQTELDAKGFFKRGPIMANKTIVAGVIERGGDLRLKVVPNVRKTTLQAFISSHVADDANAIYTDELRSYQGIADEDTRHETVNHSAKEYVRGDVHTNSIENVWSLFKRSIVGSYHQLSVKHLPAYLDEMEWRFNNRDNPYLFRDTLKALLTADPLEYRALTAD